MKKLLAVLVVFTLIAAAGFAQDFGAGAGAKVGILEWNSNGGDPSTSYDSWFWIGVSKVNDEGTMGAKGSISFGINNGGASLNNPGDTYYYGWWQPIPQLFIKIGKVGEDGKYWAGAGIVGWDFQSNDLLISPAFNYYNGFAGSILGDSHGFYDNGLGDTNALQLSIIPVDGLAINFGWDFGGGRDALGTFWRTLAFQLVYNFPIGQAAVGFKNDNDDINVAAQWNMPIADKMKFEVGFKFGVDSNSSTLHPFDVGVGFGYGSPWGDAFWVNARLGASIDFDGGPYKIGLDFCPSYDLGVVRIYLPIGFALNIPGGGGDINFAWSVNPYIRKQMGGMEFWAGVKLYNGAISGARGDGGSGNWYPEVYNKPSQEQFNLSIPIAFLWAW